MSRPTHDEYFTAMLQLVASRSTCPRRSVAAIITSKDHFILSTGYNGVPRGVPHCLDTPCDGRYDQPGQSDRCLAVHAEQNALLHCHRLDLAHTLYVSCLPCFTCAKLVTQTSIKRVVYRQPYADERCYNLFKLAEVELVQV